LNGDLYVFVYNDGLSSTADITFATTQTPYVLDSWTGERTPLAVYSVANGSTTISFDFESTQATILLFSGSVSNSTPAPIATQPYPPVSLSNWTLTVEQWLPPHDLFDVETVARKVNLTTTGLGPILSSWADLNLTKASGIGYYTTNFSWDSLPDTKVFMIIPPVYEGIIGSINDQELPPLDITNPRVDVTSYLVSGVNKILLKVSTTLWNSVVPVWSNLMTQGVSPAMPIEYIEAAGFPPTDNGIIGEVRLTFV
jgi:hypothetical protein